MVDAGLGIFPKSAAGAPPLHAIGVCKTYRTPDRTGRLVLERLDFALREGEIVAILGKSGSGKSTFLRILAGLIPASEGRVEYRGGLVTAPVRGVAMVFQSFALFPWLTVLGNVELGLEAQGVSAAERRRRAVDAIDLIGLDGFESAYPKELSGGMRQRVGFARALVVNPDILLLDEPLSNLDANLREEMRFEVRRLHDAYRYTTVYVTHDQSEAMTTADLICVMNNGKIEQSGSPEDIYDRPQSEFVARFIGSSNVIKGAALDEARIDFAGVPLRCVGDKLKVGTQTPVSIRPHDIALSASQPQQSDNIVPATVVRQVFLGGSRDYMVEVRDGTQLRIVTAAQDNIPQGSSVWLHLPPGRCRALNR